MEVEKIILYRKLNPDGTIRIYRKDDLVLYRDKVFKLDIAQTNSGKLDLTPPAINSLYWTEMDVPNRFLISESTPIGIKFLGDRWHKPSTNITYTYIKVQDKYNWVAA